MQDGCRIPRGLTAPQPPTSSPVYRPESVTHVSFTPSAALHHLHATSISRAQICGDRSHLSSWQMESYGLKCVKFDTVSSRLTESDLLVLVNWTSNWKTVNQCWFSFDLRRKNFRLGPQWTYFKLIQQTSQPCTYGLFWREDNNSN